MNVLPTYYYQVDSDTLNHRCRHKDKRASNKLPAYYYLSPKWGNLLVVLIYQCREPPSGAFETKRRGSR